jgi:hypothetical protein
LNELVLLQSAGVADAAQLPPSLEKKIEAPISAATGWSFL